MIMSSTIHVFLVQTWKATLNIVGTDRPITSLTPIEYAVLRLGTYELFDEPTIPSRVVINEALKITKYYGTIEGYKYVNAVLDMLSRSRGLRSLLLWGQFVHFFLVLHPIFIVRLSFFLCINLFIFWLDGFYLVFITCCQINSINRQAFLFILFITGLFF